MLWASLEIDIFKSLPYNRTYMKALIDISSYFYALIKTSQSKYFQKDQVYSLQFAITIH